MLNLYSYINVIIKLKNFSEEKKHEQHTDKYSSKINTKRVKSRKRKHKHHSDNLELESTNDHLANESPQHAIKLFVSFICLKNSRKFKMCFV